MPTHAVSHQNGGTDEINVGALSGELADAQKVAVSKNSGVTVGTQSTLNFIEGTNITLTITDDGPGSEVDITIAATGGGTPGGADTQVQFNDSGAFGGNAALLFNKNTTTPLVSIVGVTNATLRLDDGTHAMDIEVDGTNPRIEADSAANLIVTNQGAGSVEVPEIENMQSATFRTLQTDSSSSGSITFDWPSDTKLKTTLTENVTSITMTDPPGPGNFMLEIVQDSTPRTFTGWPAKVKWVGDVEPVISTGSGAVGLLAFYFNGTDWYGSFLQNFS